MAAGRAANRLAHETSPYLLQHAHNPVDWHPWGPEAFERARREDKPILLSVGYSACHWCHVMERECFKNPDIAAAMNADFVNVKVDREERPDVDQVYMGAVQLMTGQGGWPMTVFLTPDGRPIFAGTYFPPEDRYGRPGLPRVLEAVSHAWREKRAELLSQGARLLEHVRSTGSLAADEADQDLSVEDLTSAFRRLQEGFDNKLGGFGDAPKFPQPMLLEFLLRYAARADQAEALRMVTLTLDEMAAGGIYDHAGGGFHRYSTDRYWLVPHFEKMLYDNAQLATMYLRAWQATGEARYRGVVEETLDFVRREMTDPSGGFYSSLDADSEGQEGAFYVWKLDEIERLLGADDADLFRRAYDITPRGNWEGRSILNAAVTPTVLARSLGVEPSSVEQRLAAMRRKLLSAREERPRPGRDEKVITAWNGLMLAAFAEAAAVLGRADYLQAAVGNAELVLRELRQDGRLMRTAKRVADDGRPGPGDSSRHEPSLRVAPIAAYLDDYACYADGLLRLYEGTFDLRWLVAAQELMSEARARFLGSDGIFYMTEEVAADAPPIRAREVMDNATPSGNSVAADVMLRLAVLTGEGSWRSDAERVLRQLREAMVEHPAAFGRLLCAADFLIGPVQELAVVGSPDNAGTAALVAAARADYHPNLVTAAGEPDGAASSRVPLLAGKQTVGGLPAAYVCRNHACQHPTGDPTELRRLLST